MSDKVNRTAMTFTITEVEMKASKNGKRRSKISTENMGTTHTLSPQQGLETE
jgi:hypothetical protein